MGYFTRHRFDASLDELRPVICNLLVDGGGTGFAGAGSATTGRTMRNAATAISITRKVQLMMRIPWGRLSAFPIILRDGWVDFQPKRSTRWSIVGSGFARFKPARSRARPQRRLAADGTALTKMSRWGTPVFRRTPLARLRDQSAVPRRCRCESRRRH